MWALLIQGVLNHAELDDLCDDYGNDLYQAANYYNILNDLATKKVMKIIQHAVNSDQKYKNFLKDDKYTFLRTKSFYDLCMNHAKNELGWQKKSF